MKFQILDCNLQIACGAVGCNGRRKTHEMCLGKVQPQKSWALSGTIKIIEPKVKYLIRFSSADMAKYFIMPTFLQDTSFAQVPDEYELYEALHDVIEAYRNSGITWTFLGYCKPNVKGK